MDQALMHHHLPIHHLMVLEVDMFKIFIVFVIAMTIGMACRKFCGHSEPLPDVSQYEVAKPIYKTTSN